MSVRKRVLHSYLAHVSNRTVKRGKNTLKKRLAYQMNKLQASVKYFSSCLSWNLFFLHERYFQPNYNTM